MAYREKMSDEELKEELVFLALGTVENFEFWLEDFDWFSAPYPRCALVREVVEQFCSVPNSTRLGIVFAKLRLAQRKKAEEDGFLSGIIL